MDEWSKVCALHCMLNTSALPPVNAIAALFDYQLKKLAVSCSLLKLSLKPNLFSSQLIDRFLFNLITNFQISHKILQLAFINLNIEVHSEPEYVQVSHFKMYSTCSSQSNTTVYATIPSRGQPTTSHFCLNQF